MAPNPKLETYPLFGDIRIPMPPSELYTALIMVVAFLPIVVVVNFIVSRLIGAVKPKRA